MGFVGGLLAVCMPCIWPIIPMTVSFFLKRAKDDKARGVRDAITYGVSIIVIYLGLGLLVTALFGSDTLNAMSTNAVFNIFLFLLLVVFALSFFGWFEIRLPDSWANKVDQKSEELSTKAAAYSSLFTLHSSLNMKEIELIQKMNEFGAAVEQAGKDYSPSGIANYCYELTKVFNQFYHDYSILNEPDEQKKAVRLMLARNVAKIIKRGMAILGIEVPERM
jgi:hypothetical protein